MDAGINNVIYMELHSGPKMANSTCGKTIVAGTIEVPLYIVLKCMHTVYKCTFTVCAVHIYSTGPYVL